MCGIFGFVVGAESSLLLGRAGVDRINLMFRLSASRGKEAAGLAIANQQSLVIYKEPIAAEEMIKKRTFKAVLAEVLAPNQQSSEVGLALVGHSRLVTDGAREINRNNQPVWSGSVVGIHNGIIVNHERLFSEHELARDVEVDSAVIFALLHHHLSGNKDVRVAVGDTFRELRGTASVAALFRDRNELLLATNNGSLYFLHAEREKAFLFASHHLQTRAKTPHRLQ